MSKEIKVLKSDIQPRTKSLSILSKDNQALKNESIEIKSIVEKTKIDTQANKTKINEITRMSEIFHTIQKSHLMA